MQISPLEEKLIRYIDKALKAQFEIRMPSFCVANKAKYEFSLSPIYKEKCIKWMKEKFQISIAVIGLAAVLNNMLVI